MLPSLQVNQQIEILVGNNGNGLRFVSRILKISDSELMVFRPLFDNKPLEVEDEMLTVVVKENALWRLNCRVLEQSHMYIVLKFPTPEDVNRLQRRQFLRAEVKIPTCVRVENGGVLSSPFSGTLLDLSAGGCRLQCTEEIPQHVPVVLDIRLSGQGTFQVWGEVKRQQRISRKGDVQWQVRVEFKGLNPRTQEYLAKVVHGIHVEQIALAKGKHPSG